MEVKKKESSLTVSSLFGAGLGPVCLCTHSHPLQALLVSVLLETPLQEAGVMLRKWLPRG